MISINIDDNLLIRAYTEDDAAGLFNAVNTSRKHLHPWLEWVDETTKQEHSLQFILQALHHLRMQERLDLGIVYNDKIIGGIGMHHWQQSMKRAELGYWISKEYEGKGIINRCLVKFIDFLFEKIGLNKIEIHFIPGNKRSAKVAECLGFKVEGVIRQSVMRNGMPEDIVIMGLLKSEWKPLFPKRGPSI